MSVPPHSPYAPQLPHGDADGRASDVLVVGAGPVGLACALYLARDGWTVTVLERWPAPYAQPRAVHFDDEVARLLADAGLGDRLPGLTETVDTYEWRNADGRTLLSFDWSGLGPSGWPTASMMYQPDLETALADSAQTHERITVLRGHEAVDLVRHEESVTVVARDRDDTEHRFTAAWVVGCDGANSFVRDHVGAEMTDLGFFYDWLIVDVRPREDRTWSPVNLQICDPRRPTTLVSGGPGRRRWEFMRMPGESVEDLNTEARAWEFLEPWNLTPQNSVLERHAVYTFQARWADVWRSGRLFLAGDAAHLMPPFAGQGMCSGIRDAANLSWKLGQVLRGNATPAILDTYGTERAAHVQHAIGMSVELGKVICVTDPEAAAQRDAFMIGLDADPARILPPLPPPMLTDGLIAHGESGRPAGSAGRLSMQARLRRGGRTGLLDEVVGRGFVVAATSDPRDLLDPGRLAFLEGLGTHLVHLRAPGSEAVAETDAVDVDDVYLPHLQGAGHIAALIRPDHYVFGTAHTAQELNDLVTELRRMLEAPAPGSTAVASLALASAPAAPPATAAEQASAQASPTADTARDTSVPAGGA
ncbi:MULTISPECIES: bifunctional 3-(3-hydroxy-phenyl)propionate/3-hydroxycinnamic acid hydroxylase [unclassified Streptomyces]|uniref:bifunctional 3-(3-hydroxy-phenyl)propionate/3-hydroxycinnamic acid hydroxylase MhpA n=1 Tax=unclassified Streptomyces TaxID=2593676 RepID=UPI003316793C